MAPEKSQGNLIGVRVVWTTALLADGYVLEQWNNNQLTRSTITGSTTTGVSGCFWGVPTTYRVGAWNRYGTTYGPTSIFVCDAQPAAPSLATATALSPTSIRVDWSDNASNEAEFLVRLGLLGPWFFPANATSGTITGLAPGTGYTATVYARSPQGVLSNASNRPSVRTPPDAVIPPPPTGLAADTVSDSEIHLRWTDSAVGAHGLEIQHSTDGVSWPAASADYPRVDNVDFTETSDTGLPAATRHYYRARLYTSAGNSSFSDVVTTSTFALAAPPAPTNLTASASSPSTVRIRFTDNSSGPANEEAFLLTATCAGTTVVTDASVLPEVDVINLAPGATCQFKVRAGNRVNGVRQYSPFSNTATATTPGGGAASTRFVNSSSYPVISLVIDGAEQIGHSPLGIGPNSYYELQLTAGGHTFSARTGFWMDDGTRYVMYSFTSPINVQASGQTTVPLQNPTVGQLLTLLTSDGSVGYWVGGTWEGTTPHTQALCFHGDGSWRSYRDGVLTASGTSSITSYPRPGVFSVEFGLSGSSGYRGRLDEISHNVFDMRNGPPGWEWVEYTYSRRAACP